MQVIANNLANVNTTGFKRDRANFETLFYQVIKEAGAQTADDTSLTSPLAVGTGVKVVSTQKLFTRVALWLRIIRLILQSMVKAFSKRYCQMVGLVYTRDGAFSRNAEGLLTTASGYVVQPQVEIPEDATNINIAANGAVNVTVAGNAFAQEVGQISLVNFGNPRGLLPIGQNFLVESSGERSATGGRTLRWWFWLCHPGICRGLKCKCGAAIGRYD